MTSTDCLIRSLELPVAMRMAARRGVSKVPVAYVIQTGQQLLNTGNSWGQDGKTLIAIAIAIAGLIFGSLTITAFRASTT